VPYYTGFESFVTNIGSVENKGAEFAVDARHKLGSVDFQLGYNISVNRSKVLDLSKASGSVAEVAADGARRNAEPLGDLATRKPPFEDPGCLVATEEAVDRGGGDLAVAHADLGHAAGLLQRLADQVAGGAARYRSQSKDTDRMREIGAGQKKGDGDQHQQAGEDEEQVVVA